MDDNKNYRYSVKEIEQFVDLWNQGVPTQEIAEQFRRNPQSISNLACSLRRRGYDLKTKDRREEAVRLYKRANQPKGTYSDQYEYLTEEDETPDTITVSQDDNQPAADSPLVWSDWEEDETEETADDGYNEAEVVDEPIYQAPRPNSKMEVTTIVTIDGREVSRSTSTTYLEA